MHQRAQALVDSFSTNGSKPSPAKGIVHDVLVAPRGSSIGTILGVGGWWFLGKSPPGYRQNPLYRILTCSPLFSLHAELLFFSRFELVKTTWIADRAWNLGMSRDIPEDAHIHPTVQAMRRANVLSEAQMPVKGGWRTKRNFWNLWGLFWTNNSRVRLE